MSLLQIEHWKPSEAGTVAPQGAEQPASRDLDVEGTVPVRACTSAPLPSPAQGSVCTLLLSGLLGTRYECRVHDNPNIKSVEELDLARPSCAEVGPGPRVPFVNGEPLPRCHACTAGGCRHPHSPLLETR